MTLTLDYINTITPKHGRTGCTDDDCYNGSYEIKEQKLREVLVERRFDQRPRCTRCFLMNTLKDNDGQLDPRITLDIVVTIGVVEPEFEIKAK